MFPFLSYSPKNVDFAAPNSSYKSTINLTSRSNSVCRVICFRYHQQQRHQNPHDPLAESFGTQCPYIDRLLECTEGCSCCTCKMIMLHSTQEYDISGSYEAVKTLFMYPVSACAAERSFRSMKRLQTPLPNTMNPQGKKSVSRVCATSLHSTKKDASLFAYK